MDKFYKWVMVTFATVFISMFGWNLYQTYNLNACCSTHNTVIKNLNDNKEFLKKLINEKNRNTNSRIDRVVDKQGVKNDDATKERKKIIDKLDKIFYFLKYHNSDFSETFKHKTDTLLTKNNYQ